MYLFNYKCLPLQVVRVSLSLLQIIFKNDLVLSPIIFIKSNLQRSTNLIYIRILFKFLSHFVWCMRGRTAGRRYRWSEIHCIHIRSFYSSTFASKNYKFKYNSFTNFVSVFSASWYRLSWILYSYCNVFKFT